jgi:hypothetical protein
VNTPPSGDAMSVRYHRDADAAALKRQKLRRPIAWTMHPADAAECAAKGEHCHTRKCHDPAVIVTWRYWRSAEVGRVLVAEHVVCVDHGQEFADRHHIEVEPAPAEPSRGRSTPGAEGGPR